MSGFLFCRVSRGWRGHSSLLKASGLSHRPRPGIAPLGRSRRGKPIRLGWPDRRLFGRLVAMDCRRHNAVRLRRPDAPGPGRGLRPRLLPLSLEAFASPLAAAGWNLQPLCCAAGCCPAGRAGPSRRGRCGHPPAVAVSLVAIGSVRRAARRLLFDLDDAIFYRDSNRRRGPRSARRMRRFQATVRAADAVLAGNWFLVRPGRRGGEHRQGPLLSHVRRHRPLPVGRHRRPPGQVKLVWIGSRSTALSLLDARPNLQTAAARLPGLTLRMICDWFPDLGSSIPIEHRRLERAGRGRGPGRGRRGP